MLKVMIDMLNNRNWKIRCFQLCLIKHLETGQVEFSILLCGFKDLISLFLLNINLNQTDMENTIVMYWYIVKSIICFFD